MLMLWLNWLIAKLKLSPSFLFLFYDISYIYSGATTGLIPIYVTVY